MSVDVDFAGKIVDPRGRGDEDEIERADFARLLARSLAPYHMRVSSRFFELEDAAVRAEEDREAALSAMRKLRRERIEVRDQILSMVSESGAGNQLRELVQEKPALIGRTVTVTVPVSDDIDQYLKGFVQPDLPEEVRRVNDNQIEWAERLKASGEIEARFNFIFFTHADSQDPELAGLASALLGSIMAIAVCFMLSFPIGVAAAIYLEEFAPRNRWTDFIEVNINNLAAVPSIIFGLLGLAVFINQFGLPRSAPLVGGMVLALMTLPTIIIASRASLKAVPPSIREGALGVGASKLQSVFHHVLPLAMPGILTGSIIGMAQALGETAPLLMIGMVAFVTEIPASITEPATALPVQIFMWADRPQAAFEERAAGAIIVLLAVLFLVNILAVLARRRFERRW
ncbi:MAG: phosphate ABC transporter permease PstA [Alphaproteobacteria bacterium]